MKKRVYMYVNYDNVVVLKTYLDIIGTALEKCGYEYSYVKNLDNVSKDDLIVFPVTRDAIKYYMKGYRNIIQWQQGIAGEESYMRHQSFLRKIILHKIDKFVMKRSKAIFFVSNFMKEYYEKLCNIDFSKKSFVMPCFNESLDENIFFNKKYEQKTFAYVGSLAKWQCFEETVILYKSIENRCEKTQLLVLTFEKEKAEKILSKYKIKNYIVKTVNKEEVKSELKNVVYGFVIRDNVIVNKVATPTKLSSYLAAGVIPVFSSCLVDFSKISKKYNIGYCLNSMDQLDELIGFIEKRKSNENIKTNIKNIFKTYYNIDYYVDAIYSFFTERVKLDE